MSCSTSSSATRAHRAAPRPRRLRLPLGGQGRCATVCVLGSRRIAAGARPRLVPGEAQHAAWRPILPDARLSAARQRLSWHRSRRLRFGLNSDPRSQGGGTWGNQGFSHDRRVRRRADPGRVAHGRLARSLRDQLHVLPQPGHVPARRVRGRRRGVAALVGGGGDARGPGARLRRARRRRPAGRRLRAARPGGDARHARLLGITSAQLALPRDRRHLLVRGAGAHGRARDTGARPGDAGPPPPAAHPRRARPGGLPRRARRARLRRHALAAARRAARVPRVHGGAGRALRRLRRPEVRRRARVLVARAAPDLDGLRHVRDRDGGCVADPGREHRRLLPLHPDAARHAHRARRLGADRDRGHDLRRRLRGRRDGRDEPVRGRLPADLEHRPARRARGRDRRPGHRRQHHQRLHGRALAREHGSVPRALSRDAARRRRGRHARRVPGLRPPRTGLDHAPGQRGRAADRRRARRLPRPPSRPHRRRGAVRSERPLPVPERRQRRGGARRRRRRRRLLRAAALLAQGRVGRRRGRGDLPRPRRRVPPAGEKPAPEPIVE